MYQLSIIGKNLLSSNVSSRCPHNMVNFSLLAAEIYPVVWGIPANFNRFYVLAALLHGTLVMGVNQSLQHWTESATYIWHGGDHVGHWPTFYHNNNKNRFMALCPGLPGSASTHPPSWSSSNLYQLLLSTMIHSILPVQTTCLAISLHNLSPRPLWSTSWSGALHVIFHTFLHPISVFFSQHMPIPPQPVLL